MSQQPNTDEQYLYCLWCQGIPQKVLLKFDGFGLLDEEITKEINIPQWLFEKKVSYFANT